jgi:uncharacterized BrkB/YihY/UPF0761 family membrane protein
VQLRLLKNKVKFFFTKPIGISCIDCSLQLRCLGGPKCIHPDHGGSWAMSGYLISVSLLCTTVMSGLMYVYDPPVVIKKYLLLTWVSGSFWTLLSYHGYYYFQRKRRKREEERLKTP